MMQKTIVVKEVRIRRKDGLYFMIFGMKPWETKWTDKNHALVFPSRNQAKLVREQIKHYHPEYMLELEANFIEE